MKPALRIRGDQLPRAKRGNEGAQMQLSAPPLPTITAPSSHTLPPSRRQLGDHPNQAHELLLLEVPAKMEGYHVGATTHSSVGKAQSVRACHHTAPNIAHGVSLLGARRRTTVAKKAGGGGEFYLCQALQSSRVMKTHNPSNHNEHSTRTGENPAANK